MTDIHQCPLLARRYTYLELLSEGRWVLKGQKRTDETGRPSDDCILTLVLWCPACGKDCRPETTWRPQNTPDLTTELEEALGVDPGDAKIVCRVLRPTHVSSPVVVRCESCKSRLVMTQDNWKDLRGWQVERQEGGWVGRCPDHLRFLA